VGKVGSGRIGSAPTLVLLLGVGASIFIFFFARSNVQGSERSLANERTSQTLGVIATVLMQVNAIVAAGAAAAEYTDGNPRAFRDATVGGVGLSLVSNLSLVRLERGHVKLLASVGRNPPLLLGRLTARNLEKLRRIDLAGAPLSPVSTGMAQGSRRVNFAMSPRARSDLLVYGEITAVTAQAQAGGVAPSDLRYAIYLGTKPSPGELLLSSADALPTGHNVVSAVMPIGAANLLVQLAPRHRLVSGFTWAAPWIILAAGLLGTVAIAVLVESGRRRRNEALGLVAELDRALADQRRAEQEAQAAAESLRQAQRMEAIGLLAGGVAHDFNNLLTAIIGSTRRLAGATKPGDPIRTGLQDIERAADRAASLTRQLLAFSRKQVLKPSVLDLNHVVDEMSSMLRHLVRANIGIVTVTGSDVPPVEADASQIDQVIINLVVNAADAIPDSGTITIATGDALVADEDASGQLSPRRFAVLSVSDDGVGMDQKTVERVFEPFFTTKELGRGTGLGLATVYGIVEQSGGSIDVESEPGRGTTFRVLLPGVDKHVVQPAPQPGMPASTAGTETVAVAEDDEMVRMLVRVTLEDSGYTVLEAANGDAALELCRHHAGPIHALVTDMVMPGMGGRALADRLTALRPGLPVLYITGYTESDAVDGSSDVETAFVQKPFTPEQLAAEVRALIDRAAAALEQLST
jgi:signal transduction histidine kinase